MRSLAVPIADKVSPIRFNQARDPNHSGGLEALIYRLKTGRYSVAETVLYGQ